MLSGVNGTVGIILYDKPSDIITLILTPLCIVPKATVNPDGSKKWRLIQSLIREVYVIHREIGGRLVAVRRPSSGHPAAVWRSPGRTRYRKFSYTSLNVSENSLHVNFRLETNRELLEKLPAGSTTFSFFDSRSSFDSLLLDESMRCFTGFIAPDPDNPSTFATFGQNRYPQGHCNGTANLVLTYNDIFRMAIANHGLAVYCDDYLLGHRTVWDMIRSLEATFAIAQRSRVRFSADKSYFAVQSGVFAGLQVSKSGITVPRKYCEKVRDIPTPQTTKQLQRFLGLVCYVKSFIVDYSKHVALLTPYINKEKKLGQTKLDFTTDALKAIDALKVNLLDPLALHTVDLTIEGSELHVFCDASDRSYGCILFQKVPAVAGKPVYRLIDYRGTINRST